MQLDTKRIYIAGHRGMVGAAVGRVLQARGCENLIGRASGELDLRRQQDVEDFFATEKPEVVVFAAARVGGIHANDTYPADFYYDNAQMSISAIQAAMNAGVKRFLYLGSTCIYPRMAPQPIREDSLLSAYLEPTNEAYALAKIGGLKMCQFYRRQYGVMFHSAMPTNLYGPGDNYHPENSHVLPALIRRMHEAREAGAPEVKVWGTGRPRREFLHVDDLAGAIVHLLQLDDPPDWINVGTGHDISVAELAKLVAQVVGYEGKIVYDPSRPDGTPFKRTDTSLMEQLGWKPQIDLTQGIQQTYECFLQEFQTGSLRTD